MSEQTKNILLKITPEIRKDMETIWFTADQHHGHPKIIDICNRPIFFTEKEFDDAGVLEKNLKDKSYKKLMNDAHNEWLVKEVINKWVGKKDTIYFVGDLSMAKRSIAEKFIDRLNGNKFLIIGNHDKNIKNSTRFSQTILKKNFTYSRFGINIHIVLDHNPSASWDRKVHGSWHLYGHVHGRFKNQGLSFDVGIDNPELLGITGGIHRPINLYEVVRLMSKKEKEMNEKHQGFYD